MPSDEIDIGNNVKLKVLRINHLCVGDSLENKKYQNVEVLDHASDVSYDDIRSLSKERLKDTLVHYVEPPASDNLSKPVILESITPRHRKRKMRPASEKVVDEEDEEDEHDGDEEDTPDEDDSAFISQDDEDPGE
ncbi:uncharacterized protein TRUGW13939_06406 [Talaromyces rugulosus]|uniref:Uncharacterized protein n=1 Tax=Talaromyces rugulosus TaxID=121627 RepID=A0A7H8QYR7_TALRU|nr:uncharacterized protein TRUGW13939_06406 [Talaromyces rugulosus]QKX59274.1 hypothetical protein TRUGW13939_06406 [Talaromyces rugulosus]